MDLVDQDPRADQRAEQAREDASSWLADFETALSSRDAARIAALFHANSHWRDILAFTWYYTAIAGSREIAERLAAEQPIVRAREFHLPDGRRAPRHVKRVGIDSIEVIFEFTTAIGGGARYCPPVSRRRPDTENLADIDNSAIDHRARKDQAPTVPPAPRTRAISAGTTGLTRGGRRLCTDNREPTVLVIGGARRVCRRRHVEPNGRSIRLWWKNGRGWGNSWRKRYHSLALHNSIQFEPPAVHGLSVDVAGLHSQGHAG